MKTSELTGKDLDYWVAKAQGWEINCDWWIVSGKNVKESVNKYCLKKTGEL